jgi:hypothetical protein
MDTISRVRYLITTMRAEFLAKHGWVGPDNRFALLDLIAKYKK